MPLSTSMSITGIGSLPLSSGNLVGFKTGGIAGSVTFKRLKDRPCTMANLMAPASNAGKVYLGANEAVIKEAGAEDDVTGWELAAGQATGWMPIDNLNRFYIICTNATDDLLYMLI